VAFLAEQQLYWIMAWLPWNLAALTMLYFVVSFARAYRGRGLSESLLTCAVLACAVAVPLDLTAEVIEMFVLPGLAVETLLLDPQPRILFQTWERIATVLTACFANGLYTLSSVLLIWSTRRSFPRWIVAAGAIVGVAGFCLSAAALADSVTGMVITNIILLPAILAWQMGVATAERQHVPCS
jgi:hypothetical protein